MSFSLQLKVKIYVINVNFVAKFGCCIDLLNQMVNIYVVVTLMCCSAMTENEAYS